MYTGQWLAADTSKNILASFNPTTGGLSTIGPMGFDVARYNGMDISPDTGIMYLVSAATSSDPQGNLYVVDKLTGMSTLVGQVGYFGNEVLYRALTVAPEPSSIALLGLGALGLMLARRRQ
jgi:DNA-binding phage protein